MVFIGALLFEVVVIFFRASYMDGKPTGACKPCAGNQGTLILVDIKMTLC